jgi:hypothetical protein
VGVILGVLINIGGMVASLFVGFAGVAAYIRYYEDAKSASAAPVPGRA